MVSAEIVRNQLEKLHFNVNGWGRAEVKELPHILMPDEEIYDLVNGMYEGGFALLVATNLRILLVDKKPLNYLTVEDLRFDMISEIDYSHRVFGASVSVSTGSKNLKFTSYNQQRLRKLTTHVQHRMSDLKKQANSHREDQKQHLEQINQQLQAYLIAQHEQQQHMNHALRAGNEARQVIDVEPLKPDNRLADYLYAQSLLSQHPATEDQADVQTLQLASSATPAFAEADPASQQPINNDLYNEGVQEVFGNASKTSQRQSSQQRHVGALGFEIHPLNIAYAKLPHILRNRFGRFGGSKQTAQSPTPTPTTTR